MMIFWSIRSGEQHTKSWQKIAPPEVVQLWR